MAGVTIGSSIGVYPLAALRMTEMTIWSNPVADKALDLGKIRKCASNLAGPDRFAVYPHVEDTTTGGYEHHFAQLAFERHEQLLGHPCRAKQPSTLGTVLDLQPRPSHTSMVIVLGTPLAPPTGGRCLLR